MLTKRSRGRAATQGGGGGGRGSRLPRDGGGREEKRETGRSEGKSITQIQLSAELAAGPGERGGAGGAGESQQLGSHLRLDFPSCFSSLSLRPPCHPGWDAALAILRQKKKKMPPSMPPSPLSQLIRRFLSPPPPGLEETLPSARSCEVTPSQHPSAVNGGRRRSARWGWRGISLTSPPPLPLKKHT